MSSYLIPFKFFFCQQIQKSGQSQTQVLSTLLIHVFLLDSELNYAKYCTIINVY